MSATIMFYNKHSGGSLNLNILDPEYFGKCRSEYVLKQKPFREGSAKVPRRLRFVVFPFFFFMFVSVFPCFMFLFLLLLFLLFPFVCLM